MLKPRRTRSGGYSLLDDEQIGIVGIVVSLIVVVADHICILQDAEDLGYVAIDIRVRRSLIKCSRMV